MPMSWKRPGCKLVSGPECGSSTCVCYYVGNSKLVQNANQFHIDRVCQVSGTSGAHHYKPCTIYKWALQSRD